jgi:DNA-binding NtrC family response regulator
MNSSILIVDDEQDFLESVRRGLVTKGYKNIQVERDPLEALKQVKNGTTYDVALIDITMPAMSGVELLQAIKGISPNTECIMVTAVNESQTAVDCIRKGAYDYLSKPVTRDGLVMTINQALERKRLLETLHMGRTSSVPELANPYAFESIITQAPDVMKVLKEAELHADSNVPVLITGESGTGKELLARAVHMASPRANSPFTPVNMASLNPTLFDAEFFGHTRGAFTGAERDRAGYLEHTDKGTLFLDEIGVLPVELQGKFLRVLQDGEYLKLGTSRQRRADVRFIAATNSNLDKMMAQEKFRKDLYYRLKGAWLHLPPLRERRGDIPLLCKSFLSEFSSEAVIDHDALSMICACHYPGNIRELRAVLQSAVNLSNGERILPQHLPAEIRKLAKTYKRQSETEASSRIFPLARIEKDYIIKIYHQMDKNKSKTAKALGIGLNTLRRKLETYGKE